MSCTRLSRAAGVVVLCLASRVFAQQSDVLPGTQPLTWEGEIDVRMMDGAHAFIERKIAEAAADRGRFWNLDFDSVEAYERSIEPNRERFRKMIGVVDERAEPRLEVFGSSGSSPIIGQNPFATVHRTRWDVLEGFQAEGLWVRRSRPARRGIDRATLLILIPDVGQTPEQVLRMDGESTGGDQNWWQCQLPIRDCDVIVADLVNVDRHVATQPWSDRSEQTNREWVYREAFQMGRHVIGYDVQAVLSLVDWAKVHYGQDVNIVIAGTGEGGLVALYAAASDRRIDGAYVSGYFGNREANWAEPIYRNVFGLNREFGDAEIARLVYPRQLMINSTPAPSVDVKGRTSQPSDDDVRTEVARDKTLDRVLVETEPGGVLWPYIQEWPELQQFLLFDLIARVGGASLIDECTGTWPSVHAPEDSARQQRLIRGIESHVQSLVRSSERTRAAWFPHAVEPTLADTRWNYDDPWPTLDAAKFAAGAERYREVFRNEIIGAFDEEKLPANPRTRKVYDTAAFTGYEVVLDVYPELFAWGILLVPKGIEPGERRPVVVTQHGRNGLPAQTVEGDSPAYRNFAARLAERGFVVFAPHNLYRGEDRYRWLDRKANAIGCTLFSFILAQHEQITDWLATLGFVDGERIGFYGLSYGGETAMRIPALIPRYALSICSGDFNQWTTKVASIDQPWSFMFTEEWEMPYFNMGNTFDYAEMAYLIFPRPFMVERGMHDGVGRDEWVEHEYAKVRRFYTQFGLGDRTAIARFNGGHTIHGVETFEFLHEHLRHPRPGDD